MKQIVINPGHGGSDPGAVGNNFTEAVLVKKFGDDLAAKIKELNNTVVPVFQSGNWARLPEDLNKIARDYIISIHLNAFNQVSTGTEVLYLSAKGKELAQKFQNVLVAALGLRDRGIKKIDDRRWNPSLRGLHLFRMTVGVCVLIELAFISNPNDVKVLLEKWDLAVEALAKEIIKLQWEK